MNIENTTDFSSYLKRVESDEPLDNEPKYKVVSQIYQQRKDVFYKWYIAKFDNTEYNVLVYYPQFKDLADYFNQELDKDNGIKVFYTERIVKFPDNGTIRDYTDWFKLNEDNEIDIASKIDAQSEKFFDGINTQA